MHGDGRSQVVANRPILLKKSASVPTVEKYAPEIEICVLRRRFRTRISRSSVQKRCFHPLIFEHFGQTDFFNRIDPKRTSFIYVGGLTWLLQGVPAQHIIPKFL
ncbi:hypothetical protein FHJ31_25140 [Pseudomonas sp. Fig-3]|nr:hypothetical protein FHJ31_25140 [Pseudomonas sp. Fig-3]